MSRERGARAIVSSSSLVPVYLPSWQRRPFRASTSYIKACWRAAPKATPNERTIPTALPLPRASSFTSERATALLRQLHSTYRADRCSLAMDAFFVIAAPVPEEDAAASSPEADEIFADHDRYGSAGNYGSCVIA